MEKITIKFKYDRKLGHHRIVASSNATAEHISYAISKLQVDNIQPSKLHKTIRFVKRIGKTILAKTDKGLNKKPKQIERTAYFPSCVWVD